MPNTSPVVSDLMTSQEVADYLRLSLPTVYYLAKEGKLPSFQVGSRWRFPRDEIERLRNPSPRPPRVLVVDDDPVMREVLQTGLTLAGTEVSTAEDPDEAFELAIDTPFDALLIDLVLGTRRGVDLIRKLREHYPLGRFVVITGHPDLLETASVLALGPMTVLLKPFEIHQVVECVGQIVGRKLRVPRRPPDTSGGADQEQEDETQEASE